ncbi:hypothetical protein [Niabella hibiscisoli]|uniref:hypothetical protein n=1 Tax=Niabella hibiscisoli TaxID=1825928 RepID=UPI001F0DC9D3|nr:hypothetical protein [Niabella hibiscisoli]MCH5716043.1 hypothetical protein [Niabella hibiscisoli]
MLKNSSTRLRKTLTQFFLPIKTIMLTDQEIQYLYDFCERKGVRFYDLQSELVDHLSEAIAEKQKINVEMTFEDALMHTYKEFGITGFSRVIADRENALWKSNRRAHWAHFKSYFTYPKLLITALIVLVLNMSAFILEIEDLKMYYSAITVLAGLWGLLLWISTFKSFKKPSKKLMVFDHYKNGFNIWGIAIQAPNLYFFILRGWNIDPGYSLIQHILLCCFAAIIIITSQAEYDAYKKTYFNLRKQYPLAFTSRG